MDKTSHTVPDQNMSVIEIMKRFASGRPVSGNTNPMYQEEGEMPMPDLSRMELTDRMETIERLSKEFTELRQKLYQEQLQALKSAEYKKWEEEFIKSQTAGEIVSPSSIAEK